MKCPKCKSEMTEIIIDKMFICPDCGDKQIKEGVKK